MKLSNNNKGFSLIFAMGIVLSVSLTTIYLLEYVLPFARDTKGIEFSTNAYYQSNSAIEQGLWYVSQNDLGDEDPNPPSIEGATSQNISEAFGYDIIARGNTIPPAGEGNSEYDPDWNILSPGKPLQIEIGSDSWNNAQILLRVPETGAGDNVYLKTQTGGIVSWQISSSTTTIIADNDQDRIGSDILKSGFDREFDLNGKGGKTLEGNNNTFESFYNTECNDTKKCTLKLSIINDLILDNTQETPVPYIEYQIRGLNNAPLRYTRINTEGYSSGFKKEIDIKIPQQTVNEAFDFTIFQ